MIQELQSFRSKYPGYDDLDDLTLATKLSAKYPEYADLVDKVKQEKVITPPVEAKPLVEIPKAPPVGAPPVVTPPPVGLAEDVTAITPLIQPPVAKVKLPPEERGIKFLEKFAGVSLEPIRRLYEAPEFTPETITEDVKKTLIPAGLTAIQVGFEPLARLFENIPANVITAMQEGEFSPKELIKVGTAPLRKIELKPEERKYLADIFRNYNKALGGITGVKTTPVDEMSAVMGGIGLRLLMPDIYGTTARITKGLAKRAGEYPVDIERFKRNLTDALIKQAGEPTIIGELPPALPAPPISKFPVVVAPPPPALPSPPAGVIPRAPVPPVQVATKPAKPVVTPAVAVPEALKRPRVSKRPTTVHSAIIQLGRINRASLGKDYNLKELEEDIPGLRFILTDKPDALGSDVMAGELVSHGHISVERPDEDAVPVMLEALRNKSKSLLYDFSDDIEKEANKELKIVLEEAKNEGITAEDLRQAIQRIQKESAGVALKEEGRLIENAITKAEEVKLRRKEVYSYQGKPVTYTGQTTFDGKVTVVDEATGGEINVLPDELTEWREPEQARMEVPVEEARPPEPLVRVEPPTTAERIAAEQARLKERQPFQPELEVEGRLLPGLAPKVEPEVTPSIQPGITKKVTIQGKSYPVSWKKDSKGVLRATLPLEAAQTPEGKAILRGQPEGVPTALKRQFGGVSGEILPKIPEGEEVYSALVNRFAPIENIVVRAKKLGADIKPGEDPGMRARGYLGIGGKAKSALEDKTFRITPEGNIELTGEGLRPILKDYDLKSSEKNVGIREKDLNDYLIAKRTIADLQRPKIEGKPEMIVTPEQVSKAKLTVDNLKLKYGGLEHLETTAGRLYDYQKRILNLLVDSGNLSQEQFDTILAKNPHYIPFLRILPEEAPVGAIPVSRGRFTGARAPVKRIKGSELEIENTTESIIKNTYRIMDIAERNTVARNVAKLSYFLPEEIKPVKIPIIPLAKVELKAGIDPKLTSELLSVIDNLKGIYERKLKIGGKRLGYFQPERKIVTKFATQEGVIAHELGHYIDRLYGLKEKLVKNPETVKELRVLADLRQVRKAYARKGEEKIAALMDAFITKPFILDEVAPNSKRILESIINSHEELKSLLKIRPSMVINYEKTVQTIFGPSPFKPKGNVIEYFEGGERKYVELSPNLYQAMSGLNESSVNLFTKILSRPASWLRKGATITPEFMFRNPIRDQFTALLQTKLGFKPFIDPVFAIADILGKTDSYYDWLRSGGSYSGFVELSRPQLQKLVSQVKGNKKLLSNLNIIARAGDVSQLLEQATRVGVYKRAIQKGLAPVKAGFEAREATVDFGTKGAKTKDVTAVTAFFNANVQGLDKSIRTAKNDPVGFMAKAIAFITIPSVLLYLKNRKDKMYKEIPQWQRDIFWVTKFGDTYVRIPKPFLYGQIFGSLPERFLEYLDTKDPEAFRGFRKTLIGAVSPLGGEEDPISGVLPTAIKPLIENATNWNFFMGRNIVSRSRQELLPALQFNKYTSEFAKTLGQMLNYAPAKIENLVRGWYGGTGTYALEGADSILKFFRRLKGIPAEGKRPRELADVPLVKGFVTRPPLSQPESLNRFYENLNIMGEAYKSVALLLKEEDEEGAKKIIKKYPALVYSSDFNEIAGTFSELSKEIDLIGKSTEYTTEEKRRMIMDLELQRLRMAQIANKIYTQRGK